MNYFSLLNRTEKSCVSGAVVIQTQQAGKKPVLTRCCGCLRMKVPGDRCEVWDIWDISDLQTHSARTWYQWFASSSSNSSNATSIRRHYKEVHDKRRCHYRPELHPGSLHFPPLSRSLHPYSWGSRCPKPFCFQETSGRLCRPSLHTAAVHYLGYHKFLLYCPLRALRSKLPLLFSLVKVDWLRGDWSPQVESNRPPR